MPTPTTTTLPSHRLCLKCGALTDRGRNYCRKHLERESRWKGNQGDLGHEWRKIRAAKLEANPRCERCGRKATTVDHIQPRAFGGTHAWANLMSLCPICAKAKDRQDAEEGRRRAKQRAGGGGQP